MITPAILCHHSFTSAFLVIFYVETIILMRVMTSSNVAVELRPRGSADLLRITLVLYRRHFRPFFSIALVVMGPLAALAVVGGGVTIAQFASPWRATPAAQSGASANYAATLLASLASLCASVTTIAVGVLAPWMGGALTHASIERVLGREPAWRQSYRAAYPRWAALWGANFIRQAVCWICLLPLITALYGLVASALIGRATAQDVSAGAAGLMLACSPFALIGLALACIAGVNWSLSEPAIVGENVGALESLARSNKLVAGLRGRMLGRMLAFWLVQFVLLVLPVLSLQLAVLSVSTIAATGISPLAMAGLAGATLFGAVMGVALAPFNVIFITANYLDMRVRKEGLAEQIRSMQQAAPRPPIELADRAE